MDIRLLAPASQVGGGMVAPLRAAFLPVAALRASAIDGLLRRSPAFRAVLLAVPVKTLAVLSFTGVLSVIFATLPAITARSFGGSCGAAAALFLTVASRVAGDAEVVDTFSPIMSGTPRQKTRALHAAARYVGVGFALLGACITGASRLHRAQTSNGPPEPPGAAGAFAAVAVALVSVQVAAATPYDEAEPLHAALDAVALDAVSLAQAAAVALLGASSLSTALVASSLGLLWLANAAQLRARADGGGLGDPEEPPLLGFAV